MKAKADDISPHWRTGVVERHAPALGEDHWIRLPEYIEVWPGEDPGLLAREFEKDESRFGPKATLRVHIFDF